MERISYGELPHGMMGALLNVEILINKSGLDLKMLEIIRLRVAQLNSCAYCIDHHFKELQHTGESALRMYSLSAWRETDYYTDKERMVLEFTEELTRMGVEGVTDQMFDELNKFFSKHEISYLTLGFSSFIPIIISIKFSKEIAKYLSNPLHDEK